MTGMEEDTDRLESTTVLPTNVLEEHAVAQQVQVGTILRDRFMLVEEVAGGSMGVVYKALDRRLAEADADDHWVAIKVLTPQLSHNADALRALQQEAVKTRCLTHPNIVRFVDLDRDDKLYFIVTEWLEGSSLYDVLNQSANNKLDLATALDITMQVGTALDYAHQRGIVHADVKPGNIMMMPSGQVKLFDFGVARIRQKQHTNKSDSDPVVLKAATPAYSSMQVLTGEDPVPADDVFSLACLAYRLITGYRVFGLRDAAAAAEEGMEPRRIESLNKAQWRALKKALAFSRVARYSSPADFVAALTASTDNLVVANEPVFAVDNFVAVELDRDDAFDELIESPSRNRRWLVAVVLISAVVVAVLLQNDLRDLFQSYTTVKVLAPLVENATAELEIGASEDIAEQIIPARSQQVAASESIPVVAKHAPELLQSGATQAVDFATLPAADIIVPLAESGSVPGESSLTLIEDGKPAIIDFVRRSNLSEFLTLRLVDAIDSSSKSPLEAGQFRISNDGLIVFAAGQHRARVTVTMASDSFREPDRETTLVVLDADYADIEFATVKLKLQDDDQRRFEDALATNTVAFAVRQVSVRERDPAVQIDVIRVKQDASQKLVNYAIRDVTATEGLDYIAPASATVSFAPGQRLARILIPVVQDTKRESDEVFILELVGDVASAENNIYQRIAVMILDDDS